MPEDERVEVPQADVDAELERAEQMLADATKAQDVGISKATVVNRLYYLIRGESSGLQAGRESDNMDVTADTAQSGVSLTRSLSLRVADI